MDLNPQPIFGPNRRPSIYERIPRHKLELADELALRFTENNDLQAVMSNAQDGFSVEEQAQAEEQMQAAQQENLKRQQLETEIADLSAQFAATNVDLPDDKFEKAAEEFKRQFESQMPQRQQAGLQAPNLAQSGLALLGAILDPQNAANNAAIPFQYQLSERDRQQGINDQQFADQTKQRQERIGAAETAMTIEERRLGKAQASQDRQSNMLRMQISDAQQALQRMDEGRQRDVNHAYTQWNTANSPQEKRIAGRRLQELLKGSSLAPKDEEIEASVQQLEAVNSRYASSEWENALKNELNAFGEIDDARAQTLESQRMAIAKRYGIAPENLRMTPTARTLAAEKLELANRQFAFLEGKAAEDFKLKWASFKLAQQRFVVYAQSLAQNYQLSADRNAISRGNLQMRSMEFAAKEMAKSSLGVLNSLNEKAVSASKTAAAFPTEENTKKADAARAKRDQLLQSVAAELGIDQGQIMKDPIGSLQKIIKSMDEDDQQREAELEGNVPFNPKLSGIIPERPQQSKRNPKRRPVATSAKPKPKGSIEDEARQRGIKID